MKRRSAVARHDTRLGRQASATETITPILDENGARRGSGSFRRRWHF